VPCALFLSKREAAHDWAAEPCQSCEPLSALICPEHDVSVLESSFETALRKFFKQHLIEGILGVGARLSQPFRDQGLRQQTLKPRDYPAVLDDSRTLPQGDWCAGPAFHTPRR